MTQLILERGTHALAGLDKVDDLFTRLKKSKTPNERKTLLKELERTMQTVFKTKFSFELVYVGAFSFNCGVMPILKKGKITKKEDLVKLGSIKEVYIIIGWKLIRQLTNRELTAILLHEIGHVVNHVSKTVAIINKTLGPVARFLEAIPIIGLALLPLTIITSRTFEWTSHMGEYNADKFAVEYGYGDDLASAMRKFSKQEKKYTQELTKFQQIIDVIKKFIFGSSHPSDKDRVKKIIERIKKEYNDKYNSRRLKQILDYYSAR